MTERRTRRKPGENWERLLQAGLYEFGLYGYHGTSTASIAARAEVPQPHLYANFSGKSDLFLLCVDVALNALTPKSTDAAGSAMPGSSPTPPRVTPPMGELIVYQAVAVLNDPVIGVSVRSKLGGHGLLAPRALADVCLTAVGALAALDG